MRSIPALAAAAVAATLLLAGCSASSPAPTSSASGGPCTPAASGTASDGVQVSGAFKAAPTATFTSPVTVDTTQRTVVTTGSGDVVQNGSVATIDFTIYNGTSGKQVFSTLSAGGSQLQLTVDSTQFIPGIVKAVACSTVGSRVVAVIPPADGFGTTGNTSLGIAATDTMVMVADIEAIIPTKADGADQPAQSGFPTVSLDATTGAPTVTIPSGAAAPTTLQTEVLKKGTGATVADGDNVTVQYQGLIWGTGKVFDQSWGNGGPRTFQTTGVVKGFSAALVGQTVGSQVVVIIPPDLGYGTAGNEAAGISGTDTLVFVIDILATVAPPSTATPTPTPTP